MALPYIILVLGYSLLASLFLWIGISIKGKWLIKFALVPMILWFGLFLYYIPPQLAGYPSDEDIVQEKVIVRFFTYKAPTATEKGEIYIVADSRFYLQEKSEKHILDPSKYTDISNNEFLRLYRLEWDEDLVKDMNKAKKQKKLITLSKKKGSGDGEGEGESGNGTKGKKGKKGGEKGKQNKGARVGDSKGKGGTGGTAKQSKYNSKYSVEALTPNQVFRKDDER